MMQLIGDQMDKRWQNLGIVVILLLIIVLSYLFFSGGFFRQVSFEEGKSEIIELWNDNAVIVNPNIPTAEITNLNSLKSDLEKYEKSIESQSPTRDRDALLKYIEIQMKIVDGMVVYGELNDNYVILLQTGTDLEALCLSLDSLRTLAYNVDALGEINQDLAELNQDFLDSYPEYAEGIEKRELPVSEGINRDVEELATLCASEGYV